MISYLRATELKKLAYAFTHSGRTLFWTVLFLIMLTYSFGTVFTLGAVDYFEQGDAQSDVEVFIREKFGTIPRSMYSLYLCLSNGTSWGFLADPLFSCHPLFFFLFLSFIAISIFGIL